MNVPPISPIATEINFQTEFMQLLNQQVSHTIKNCKNIPGLEKFNIDELREKLLFYWQELVQKGLLEALNTDDSQIRPYFVGLQAVIEYVIATEFKKNISSLTGLIHTPMPATPLCTKGGNPEALASVQVAQHSTSVMTIEARTTIIRHYLNSGAELYVIYPKDGLAKRKENEQLVYQQELTNYPAHLLDRPLDIEAVPDELVGATYFFTDAQKNLYSFIIRIPQANTTKTTGDFALGLGITTIPSIQKYLQSIVDFLERNQQDPILLPKISL